MLSNGIAKNFSKINTFSLKKFDPEIFLLNEQEIRRQKESLNLIASENYASASSLEALSTHFNNKYAEGYPKHRYYGGTEIVDKLEILTQKRALTAFHLDKAIWDVNVQALSGSAANLSVYTALVPPGGRIMGLSLADGGHLTHGHKTKKRPVSASARFWESHPYSVNPKSQLIDYEKLNNQAKQVRPKIIIAGGSAYPRNIDYNKMRQIADSVSAILMADIAHTSGLVAAGVVPSPFNYCDIVTTTTHKTLRGTRGALIFSRKEYTKLINSAVFPALQGGPHMHQIAGIAVALKEASSKDFINYQQKVLDNMQTMAKEMMNLGLDLVTNGTDTHLALIDLRKQNVDGAVVEAVLEAISISANKNAIPGDHSTGRPFGLRVGSPALTTRGLTSQDFKRVTKYVFEGIKKASELKKKYPKLKDLRNELHCDKEVSALRKEVTDFASSFPLPGYDI